ncbi:hypothetical protein BD413DRAFT_602425 [Trametes elegans]|nr:hypothetical protein BD413DRAFT_602425 [Trametes elegans]
MERRKRKKTKVNENGTVRAMLWYEDWAEGEELRRTASIVDPALPRIERLSQAAYDFKQGRPLHTNQDLSHLWDRWRLYIGLISGLQPPASRKKNAAMRDALAALAEAPADSDDDEEDEMPNARPPKEANVVVINDEGHTGPSTAKQPAPGPRSGFSEQQRQQRREYYREVRDTKMDRFLNDPETAVKIFLSGYYRDRGMIFSEKFCRDGPILISFFLNFLIRNRVFPESEKDLRKAVAVTGLAKKELPHSFVISRFVPDAFSRGCEFIFGTMTHARVWQNVSWGSDEDEPDTKRQKTDDEVKPAEAAVLQEAAGHHDIEVITADTIQAMEQDAKEIIADANAQNSVQDGDDNGGWGSIPPDATAAGVPSWGDLNAEWSTPADPDLWNNAPQTNTLLELLGPTALPLTHTTGVIERSTRRVKAVHLPAAPGKKGKKSKAERGAPDPEAVERELAARFAQVVLVPWHEWDVYDKADVTRPRILEDSRGTVVEDENAEATAVPEGAAVPAPHNPFKDEITLLVEPAAGEKLTVGVGLEATWIQLARVDPSVPVEVDMEALLNPYAAKNKPKGGPGEPVAPTKFWYMEQMLSVLPSFHTEMVPLPTTEDVFGEGDE